MGTLIPFPNQPESSSKLITQLQDYKRELPLSLEASERATAPLQSYCISPFCCARAIAYLHHLLHQVTTLYDLLEPLNSIPANRYPVAVQIRGCGCQDYSKL